MYICFARRFLLQGNYYCQPLYSACGDLYLLSKALDISVGGDDHVNGAVNILQDSFSKCLNDRTPMPEEPAKISQAGSKKVSLLVSPRTILLLMALASPPHRSSCSASW